MLKNCLNNADNNAPVLKCSNLNLYTQSAVLELSSIEEVLRLIRIQSILIFN